MADSYVWTSADGTSINLTDRAAGYAVLDAGMANLRSPAYNFVTQSFAGVDGVQVQAIKAAESTPSIGMYMRADDRQQFRAMQRALVHAMRPKAGPGTLTVTTEWSDSRSLTCYYAGGLEGDEVRTAMDPGRRWWTFVLKFLAPDPWWYGDTEMVSFGLGAGQAFFPIFPLVLSPSSVQGQFTVDLSDCDAPAFPVWTITGPGTGLVLTNQTTGQSLSLDVTLAAGDSMTIDTRPMQQSVRTADGTNLLPNVTTGTFPALWPLTETVNSVLVQLTGATSASRIVGQYQRRFAGI